MPTRRRALALVSSALFLAAPLAAGPGRASSGDDDPDFPDAKPAEGGMEEQIRRAQEGMQRQYGEAQQRQLEEFAELSERMEAQYQDLARRMEEQREQFRQRVARQWADIQESTDKTWVDYGEKSDARSKVDFEKGEVEVEVLVPVEEVAPGKGRGVAPDKLDAREAEKLRALAEEKLRQQAQRMLSQREPQGPPAPAKEPQGPPAPAKEPQGPPAPAKEPQGHAAPAKEPQGHAAPAKEPQGHAAPAKEPQGAPVMSGQIRGADGRAMTEKDAGKLAKELAPKMAVDPKPEVGEDGKPRIKVKVKIPLVPEHLKVRAERYADQIRAQARKLQIEPALVFAVAHTESAFNPMARSNAGAYGLMQLIPKQGAHEAYRHLYKTEKVVTPEYLYDPGNNIVLGSTYLEMLQRSFFGKLKNPENRQVLSIASYNCGPSKIKKAVVGDRDVDAMTPEQVVALVRRLAPEETKNYVVRVRERMALYR